MFIFFNLYFMFNTFFLLIVIYFCLTTEINFFYSDSQNLKTANRADIISVLKQKRKLFETSCYYGLFFVAFILFWKLYNLAFLKNSPLWYVFHIPCHVWCSSKGTWEPAIINSSSYTHFAPASVTRDWTYCSGTKQIEKWCLQVLKFSVTGMKISVWIR